MFKGFESNDHLTDLEKIIVDEGLAHFFGFPGDRTTLVEKYPEKWVQSEAELERVVNILCSNQTLEAEKADLLLKSNTGPFWEKYGAISGIFRAAKIYSDLGPLGLVKAIENLQLTKA